MARRLIASLTIIALLAACGSGSEGGKRANNPSQFRSQFLAFAACMRSHGEPSYPDPKFSNGSDGLQVKISPGDADPNAPAFESADHACHQLMPDGGAPTPPTAHVHAQAVKFASCMRAHGVPGFPDPDRDGAFTLPAGVNQQAPQFKRAIRDCASAEPVSLTLNQSR